MGERIAFGAWLKQRRKEQGIKPDELAERIGCSAIALLKIEAGERRPSRQIAELLAGYLRVPSDEQEAFITFARMGHAKASPSHASSLSQEASRAPWRGAHLQQTNLPAVLTPLVGREGDAEEARALLLQPRVRLLTMTGAPGIGKTRLAVQVASDLVDHFEDGVFFVDLAPVGDPEAVLATIARALGLKEASGQPIESVLLEYLRERRILLLLDNFEQILDAAPQIVKLMEACPWLKALVTSREALHLRGERLLPVPPLKLPELSHFPPVQELAGYPSVELFVECAQAVAPAFMLTEDNAYDVAGACVGLEGLPLAIELAASRAAHFSPAEMRAGLISRLELLTEGARDLPARHRTLRAAIEWGYNLLEESERTLFRRLGVFVGGFTPEAAEAISGREGGPSFARLLASLVDKNLIRRERRDGLGVLRFGMLEMLREYALEQLWESGEAEAIGKAHALYFMRLVEEVEPHLSGAEQARWLDQLEREYDNLRAAIRWAMENSKRSSDSAEEGEAVQAAEIGLRLVGTLGRFWYVRGYYREGREQLAEALALSTWPALRLSPFRAKALSAAGILVTVQGDYPSGRSLHEESLAIRREIGDKRGVGISLNHLGTMAYEQGDYATARSLFEESLAIRREIGDKLGASVALSNLATTVQQQGDHINARSLLEESLAIKREIGNKEGLANSLNNLGTLVCEQGDYARAHSLYEESLAIKREIGNKRGMALSLDNLGDLAYRQGDYAKSRPLFEESLAIKREIGDNISIPSGLAGLGGVAAAIGEPQRGARLLGAAANLWEAMSIAPEVSTRQVYELGMTSVQAQLGEEAAGKAWSEGQALSIEEAVAYALEEDSELVLGNVLPLEAGMRRTESAC